MRIGYARVSTIDQDLQLQIDALTAARCDRIFTDHVSATSTERPAFQAALRALKAGDTLVIWKLDRAFRSTKQAITVWERLRARGVELHIVTLSFVTDTPEGRHFFRGLASTAEFERDLISMRTREGMAVAKRRGQHIGRPPKLAPGDILWARRKLKSGRWTLKQLADQLNVSRDTLRRALARPMPRR
jgi:DNA invertase Pin-like site-specific DNA recombinase